MTVRNEGVAVATGDTKRTTRYDHPQYAPRCPDPSSLAAGEYLERAKAQEAVR